jgi:hypothetical protein
MPTAITPAKFQGVVKQGFERLQTYRKARAMFIAELEGQYYRQTHGLSGDEPLNLIYHTVRTIVPNMVMQNPQTDVATEYMKHREYAELLGLAIDRTVTDIKLEEQLRAWIVSAIFAFGVMKVSLAASDCFIQYGDINIDPGQVYAKIVDLDDFVFDPICTDMKESSFMGNRVRVPRQILLDDDSYNHDAVLKLPMSKFGDDNRVEEHTKSKSASETYALQDMVDVVEVWLPEADAMVSMPDPQQLIMDEYLRTTDYYGPKEGPYVLLSFSPPVPNNPLPIAPVSLWFDLHKVANRIFKRMMDQADRQKDVLAYAPAFADDAQDMIDAEDGDSVAVTDPSQMAVVSWGGANSKNQEMSQQMQMWFNYMAGNPDQVAGNMTKGTKGTKETATKSSIMQSNASVGTDDARGIVEKQTGEISKRIGWFLHNDPLIKLPLTKRETGGEYRQLMLTPEQRMGDFLEYVFKIRGKSMVPLDPTTRAHLMMEFAIKVMPAVINAAMMAMQMGFPFNIMGCLRDLADQQGLTADVMSWFDDPLFVERINLMLAMGKMNPGKAGGEGGNNTMQNGQPGQVMSTMNPDQQANSDAQAGANDSQSSMGGY